MSATGFYKRRRGILEHLEAGRLSLLDLGIHDFLCLKANPIVGNGSIFPPGVWMGSAAAILASSPAGNISERMIQRSLQHLEQIGFLRRFRTQGKHGNYPILLNRFSVRSREGKEYLINATETTAWREPKLALVSEGVGEGVGDVTPNKEIRSKNTTISCKPDRSHAPSASTKPEREAVERVWNYYLERLDKNPRLLTFSALRRQKGMARLREALEKTGGDLGKAERMLRLAVDALAASEHHAGSNDRGKRYDSWEKNLFPSQEKFEWWLERAQSL